MTELFVTADNDFPDRVMVRERFTVGHHAPRTAEVRFSPDGDQTPGDGYYVIHPQLGVGPMRPTPEEAISDFLEAHQFRNIVIENE